MNKQTVVYPCDGILHSKKKKEQMTGTYKNADEFQKHSFYWVKEARHQRLCNIISTHMTPWKS